MDLARQPDGVVDRTEHKLATARCCWPRKCPTETFSRIPWALRLHGVSTEAASSERAVKPRHLGKGLWTLRDSGTGWWARQDSNLRQHRYERRVLTS